MRMAENIATLVLAGYNSERVAGKTTSETVIDRAVYAGGGFIGGYKAVKKINGKPMVQYVIDAANSFMGQAGGVYVIGDVNQLEASDISGCELIPQGNTLGENIIRGL